MVEIFGFLAMAVMAVMILSLLCNFFASIFRKDELIWISTNNKLSLVKAKYQGHYIYYVSKKDLKLEEDIDAFGFGQSRVFMLGTTAFKEKSQAIRAISKNFDREIKMWKDMFGKSIDSLEGLEEKYGKDDVVSTTSIGL